MSIWLQSHVLLCYVCILNHFLVRLNVKIHCNFMNFSSLLQTEIIQYFQFDQDGNMYIFPHGSSREATLVRPGDELFLPNNAYNRNVKVSHEKSMFEFASVVTSSSSELVSQESTR